MVCLSNEQQKEGCIASAGSYYVPLVGDHTGAKINFRFKARHHRTQEITVVGSLNKPDGTDGTSNPLQAEFGEVTVKRDYWTEGNYEKARITLGSFL